MSKCISDINVSTFNFGSVVINKVSKVKYLGHIVTADMTDDLDIVRQNKCSYVQRNMIIRKFYMCAPDEKLKLFETHC